MPRLKPGEERQPRCTGRTAGRQCMKPAMKWANVIKHGFENRPGEGERCWLHLLYGHERRAFGRSHKGTKLKYAPRGENRRRQRWKRVKRRA